MPLKTYRPEEINGRLRKAEMLLGRGHRAPEAVNASGVSEVRPKRQDRQTSRTPSFT